MSNIQNISKSNIQHFNKKVDIFCDSVMGEWKPDKKHSNKNLIAFSRKAECDVPDQHAQKWVDPVTFEEKWISGKVNLFELKLINKQNSEISFSRSIEPALKGSVVKSVIP